MVSDKLLKVHSCTGKPELPLYISRRISTRLFSSRKYSINYKCWIKWLFVLKWRKKERKEEKKWLLFVRNANKEYILSCQFECIFMCQLWHALFPWHSNLQYHISFFLFIPVADAKGMKSKWKRTDKNVAYNEAALNGNEHTDNVL